VHERQHHTPLLPPHLDNPALLLSFFLWSWFLITPVYQWSFN
jgi:hypothetical protein